MVRTSSSSSIAIEREGSNHDRRTGLARRGDRDLDFLEGGLRLDDDPVRASLHERTRLFAERSLDGCTRDIAVGFHQPAERADVPEHVPAPAERLPRDRHRRAVDVRGTRTLAVTIEHDPAGAECIGEDHVGARLGVSTLDTDHPVRVIEVPGLAAMPGFEARILQLRTHGAVAEQHA